jgi:PAS domain S-box-containing protein
MTKPLKERRDSAQTEAERRLRAQVGAAGNVTWSSSPSGLVVEPQPDWMAFTGQTEGETLGHGWINAVHPGDRASVLSEWREALVGAGPHSTEMRVRRHDGQWRWMSMRAVPVRDDSGEIVEWCGMNVDVTDRKRAEEALRESEERLRWVSDNAEVGLTRCSGDWIYLSANPAYAKIIGAPLDQIVNRPIAEVTGAKAVETIRPYVERVLRGEHVTYEAEVPINGSGRRWLSVNYTPDIDAAGTIFGWVACVIDITDRKQAEAALHASEERFRLFMDNSPAHAWMKDENGRYVYLNRRIERHFGGQANDSLGKTDAELWPPDVAEELRRNDLAALAADCPLELIEEALEPGGGRSYWLSTKFPFLDPAGKRYVGGIALDITERKRADEEARRNELRLQLALDAASMISFEWDIQQDEVCRLDVADAGEAQPAGTYKTFASVVEAVHVEDRETFLANVNAALASCHGRYENEIRVARPDGGIVWSLEQGRVERDAHGRPARLIGVAQDITERKQAEEALREADHRKDDFLATLAHELRNPLAPLRNGLDVLRKISAPAPSVERLLVVMGGQLDHVIRLVDDLMDVSRISRGKFELQKQRMDLAAALGQAVDMDRHLMEAKGLDLRLDLAREPTPVEGDAVRLTQVFTNLLSNAARHTDQEGRVEVSLERVGDEAVVSVADTGVGIPKELLPHIFDPFVQGGGTDAQSRPGLGLGLALVRQITEMHGGAVEARSDGEGLGSTFIVRLPLLEDAMTAAVAPAPRTRSAPARPTKAHRVLVIDDQPEVVESLAFLLNVLDLEVRVANSGAKGLEACAEFEPQLILLDLSMPQMDGFETARRMKEVPAGRRAKLVALTGYGQQSARARAEEAGFDGYLVKPARLSQLEALLNSLGAGAAQETSAADPSQPGQTHSA